MTTPAAGTQTHEPSKTAPEGSSEVLNALLTLKRHNLIRWTPQGKNRVAVCAFRIRDTEGKEPYLEATDLGSNIAANVNIEHERYGMHIDSSTFNNLTT